MKSADEVLQLLLQNGKSPLSDQFLRWRVWRDWKNIVGAQIGEKSQPVGYHRRVLYVWVENSVWLQQLTYFNVQMREKVNTYVGKKWIISVRLTLDRKSVPSSAEKIEGLSDFLSKKPPSVDEEPRTCRNFRRKR